MHNMSVPWSVVMNYEMEIRKKAFELVREDGYTLKRALQAAMAHEETRALHFTIHLQIGKRQGREDTGRRPGKGGDDDDKKKRKGGKDKGGKGVVKDKVKTKGGGKRDARIMSTKGGLTVVGSTADNRLICYAYNEGRDCDGPCGMLHICRVKDCGDNHPMVEHKGYDASKGWAKA